MITSSHFVFVAVTIDKVDWKFEHQPLKVSPRSSSPGTSSLFYWELLWKFEWSSTECIHTTLEYRTRTYQQTKIITDWENDVQVPSTQLSIKYIFLIVTIPAKVSSRNFFGCEFESLKAWNFVSLKAWKLEILSASRWVYKYFFLLSIKSAYLCYENKTARPKTQFTKPKWYTVCEKKNWKIWRR